VGSNEKLELYFYTASRAYAGGVRIDFKSTVQYFLYRCSYSNIMMNFPSSLPSTRNKIWMITLTRTMGVRLKIHCNGVEVLNLLMSYSTCYDNRWSLNWSKDVEKIAFHWTDTASDGYRPYTGE
jgi:hypothetical protein